MLCLYQVGLAPGEEFKHWWSDVFNKAAQNITVKSDDVSSF